MNIYLIFSIKMPPETVHLIDKEIKRRHDVFYM